MKSDREILKETAIIKVLLIEHSQRKVSEFVDSLKYSNYEIIHVSNADTSLLREIDAYTPDVIIIDVDSPEQSMLESLGQLAVAAPRPIVMFSEKEDTTLIDTLVKSGVTAYVAGGVNLRRIKSILDTAIARFEQYQGLKKELETTKQKLTNQRVVEQAKLWLMRTKKLTEKEAYHNIRKMAMDNGQKIEDVSKNILALASL